MKSCDLSIHSNVYKLSEELGDYDIETWIKNAGFGDYSSVNEQNLQKVERVLRLNVEALTILSSLYVRD